MQGEVERKEQKPIEPRILAAADLLASAVHDLKNPLSVIRGLGELGRAASDSKKDCQYFNRIIQQVDTLDHMVIDLLSAFKPQYPSRINPTDIVQDLLQSFETLFTAKSIEVQFHSSCKRCIRLYEVQLRRAIQNLFDNALKAMPHGGKLYVSIEDRSSEILITIGDTGSGIPDKVSEKIFEPYYYRRPDGTGLGLFLTHHVIVDIHHGRLWFESSEGEGTNFYIALPATERI
mgnify:CR=1 FL=1|jgi:signal transduction histidine kinase